MFPLLLKGAKVFKNNLFLLRLVYNQEKGQSSRFCFSVSKKISKKAVIRNKIRRAGYRLLKPLLPSIKSNTLIIFSFIRIPKDDQDIIKNLTHILNDSLL